MPGLHCIRFCALGIFIASFAQSCVAGPPTGALAGYAKSREWSDNAGKFKIEASLSFANSTEVKLKKADGKVVTVPLSKLSAKDQGFIEGFLEAEASAGLSSSENPFEGGVPSSDSDAGGAANSGGGAASSTNKPFAFDNISMVKFADTRAKPIAIDFTKPFWNASPVTSLKLPDREDEIIKLPVAKDFWEKLQLKVAGAAPTAFVHIYRQGRQPNENYAKLGALRFPDGDPVPLGQSTVPWMFMAIAPDAKRIALVRDEGWDKGNDVAIVSIDESAATPEFQFTGGGGAWDELHWGSFLPNDRFASISQKFNLTVWDLKSKKAIYRGNSGGALGAVVGGRGELIAIPNRGNIAFLDGTEFKQVGLITFDRVSLPSLAFSTNGEKFAVYLPFNVLIYDMKDGKLIKNIAVANNQENLPIHWAGDYVVLDHSLVIDVERGLPMWTYEGNTTSRAIWGNQLYAVFADKESTLVSFKIPQPAAEREAAKMHRESMLAVKKGSTISLTSDLNGLTPEQQKEAQLAVANNLTSLGYKVATGTPVQVHLSLKQGERQESEYGESNSPFPFPTFGRFSGPTQKVSYQPWIHTIVVKLGKEEIFRSEQQVTSPGSVQLKEGESIQQAVDRYIKPNVEFFKSVTLPAEMLKPEYRQGLGKSQITPAGIR